ncbi:MAG TPA: Ig-like domain-containing protein, partial [Bryobacteraceae bacterium]|nr:Ig-like domain-containing protein [Bryobacteraceae bacterium]
MGLSKLLAAYLILAIFVAPGLQAANVFVLPGPSNVNQTVTMLTPVSLFQVGSIMQAPNAFKVFSKPDGSRLYIVSSSAVDSLVVADAAGNVIARHSLGAITAAELSPDGRKLAIAAATAYLLDTTVDTAPVAVNLGFVPSDVAVSVDSTRAFFVGSGTTQVSAVDLITNATVAFVTLPQSGANVATAPGGWVYVSSSNAVYEIDGRGTMAIRAEMMASGQPGKLQFTPDGLRGIALNRAGFGAGPVSILDVSSRMVTPVSSLGQIFDANAAGKLAVTSNSRAFAAGSDGRLYSITLNPPAITPVVASVSGITSVVASEEKPNARYLFFLSPTTLYRSATSLFTTDGLDTPASAGVAGLPAVLAYAGAATGVFPAGLTAVGPSPIVPPGMTTMLTVRVIDVTGKPVYNTPVAFATDGIGATILNPAVNTGMDGLARTNVTAPPFAGAFTVRATAGAGLSVSIGVAVGEGGETGTGVTAISGQGQLVNAATAGRQLVVQVRDSEGNPVGGTQVSWSPGVIGIGGAPVTVTSHQDLTDALGRAVATFSTSPLQSAELAAATIVANTLYGTATFYITAFPTFTLGSPPAPIPPPAVTFSFGSQTGVLEGRAGQTITNAVAVQVLRQAGVSFGSGIPNVGLTAGTSADPATGPTAACAGGTVLTDAQGVAVCNLVLGPRPGETQLTIDVGGYMQRTFALRIQAGVPAEITPIQGNNQSGSAGQQLPQALVAEVRDSLGNLLPFATGIQWEAVNQCATLTGSSTTANNQGRVQTLVRLGNVAGSCEIRVTTAEASATFTVQVASAAGQVTAISGGGQAAILDQAFAQPLVAEVRDAQGALLPNTPVSFAVTSGSATVSSSSVTTNAQGRAQVTVTAGASTGPVVITATSGTGSATFSLTVVPVGPSVERAGIVNGASFQQGVVPGGIVTIFGTNIVPGIQGTREANPFIGSLPTNLEGVEVLFGNTPAPIFAVANQGGREQVSVQAPFDLPAGGVTTITVRAGAGSSTISDVPVLAVQPGLFETIPRGSSRAYPVITRADGSFVTPQNPARRGEILQVFATGLGAVTPSGVTGRAGVPGQEVVAPVIVGVN